MQKLKNLFSINWKNVALIALTVFNVVAAVTAFFAGQIIWGILFSVAGIYIANVRKEILDFTNIYSAGNRIHNTNQDLRKTNARLNLTAGQIEGETKKLRLENKDLKKTVAEFKKENGKFVINNKTYGKLLGTMSQTVDKATTFLGDLNNTRRRFDSSTKRAIKEYLGTVEHFQGILQNVARMQDASSKDMKGSVNLFSGLMKNFKQSTADQLSVQNAIIREAGKLKEERLAHRKELAQLTRELDKKKQELNQVTSDLRRASDKNLDTATRLNAHVKSEGFFSRFFGGSSKAAAAG